MAIVVDVTTEIRNRMDRENDWLREQQRCPCPIPLEGSKYLGLTGCRLCQKLIPRSDQRPVHDPGRSRTPPMRR